MNRNDLHAYQERSIEFINKTKKCALWLDMGLGKTVSTLTALQDLKEQGELNSPVLIIAPLRVANSVWEQEANQWDHVDLTFSIVTGALAKRTKALETQAEIYVINRENVPWLIKNYGKAFPFKVVVIDESQSFKTPKALRFKALKKITHLIDRMILLTGTPASNGLLDIWSQTFLIDSGQALGKTMTAYKHRFFVSDYMGFKWNLKGAADTTIYKLIKPFTLSMQAADYLDMPDRIDNNIDVTLSTKQLKQYNEMKKEFLIEIGDETITAVNAAVLAGKLLQIANGAIYTEDGFTELHDGKLDALGEIIDSTNQPILVAYNFKSDLARLQKKFPQGVVMDKEGEAVTQWNNGEIPILFCNPKSASEGLNLQKGGSILVWFGLTWNLGEYLQFNARIFRQGQKKTVVINHLVTNGTIDEQVLKVIEGKDATQTSLLLALKEDMKKFAYTA
jgi:SNF2 family DNA or RNA helicase